MKLRLVLAHAVKDRSLVISWLVLLLVVVIVSIIFALQIHASELNIPIRYTAFGGKITHIYNDNWYYLFSFIIFVIGTFLIHTFIALKLFSQQGVAFARLFLHISIILLIIEYFLISSVLDIASVLQ